MQMKNQVLDLEFKQTQIDNLKANVGNLNAAAMQKVSAGAKDNADIQETYVDVYTKQIDALLSQAEQGVPPSQDQLTAIDSSLALLSATQRDEFHRRIQDALNTANQIRPQN